MTESSPKPSNESFGEMPKDGWRYARASWERTLRHSGESLLFLPGLFWTALYARKTPPQNHS